MGIDSENMLNLANSGDPAAMYFYAKSLYRSGSQMAISYFIRSASINHPLQGMACQALAEIYQTGDIVDADPQQALIWLQNGADAGDVDCMRLLGEAYSMGTIVQADSSMSFYWYKKAAAYCSEADPYVPFHVGQAYCFGIGTEEDRNAAIPYFEKAIRAFNNPEVIGQMDGALLEGVQADQALAEAKLGLCYLSDGPLHSIQKAVYWWAESYTHGMAESAFNLAILYSNGESVPVNTELCALWMTRAAEGGYAPAVEKLASVDINYGNDSNVERTSRCPQCRSFSVNIEEEKTAISIKKAIIGAVLTAPIGGVGAIAGATGGKKRVYVCRSCGFRWDCEPDNAVDKSILKAKEKIKGFFS